MRLVEISDYHRGSVRELVTGTIKNISTVLVAVKKCIITVK